MWRKHGNGSAGCGFGRACRDLSGKLCIDIGKFSWANRDGFWQKSADFGSGSAGSWSWEHVNRPVRCPFDRACRDLSGKLCLDIGKFSWANRDGFFSKTRLFYVFFSSFYVFLVLPIFFEKGGKVIQIELDDLYLESATASLESVPERILSRNTRILTQDILRVDPPVEVECSSTWKHWLEKRSLST